MLRFKKIAIIGVGLIGGSIALAIKRRKLAAEVVGVSRHKQTLVLAKRRKAIDSGSLGLEIVRGADLVIFAAPPETILRLAGQVAGFLDKNCLVTDVASTKENIVPVLSRLFPHYLGSHPLAGSEKRGILNAQQDIFSGSLCIICPNQETSLRATSRITGFWKALGCKVVSLSPAAHDRALAFVSHLPHVIAFALIFSVPKRYLKFAATGLKDTTRIAASEPKLWREIFLSNKGLLLSLGEFAANFSRLKNAIQNKDKRTLAKIMQSASEKRKSLE